VCAEDIVGYGRGCFDDDIESSLLSVQFDFGVGQDGVVDFDVDSGFAFGVVLLDEDFLGDIVDVFGQLCGCGGCWLLGLFGRDGCLSGLSGGMLAGGF